ncbi:hypothetical protein EHQ12_11920 [Leptospira gomenensis]|uniref:Uncharacterized protein n=1 Tax=Leptospira gomenensis TaxID=2484974 RepID=A0A5F1YXP8_9LEPT|nr:hypothetical protein [Leptospira gomenensis]TGK32645.1 hypothetical protein EHQ17_11765 [Leptospira gomenensis]TGK36793.1 hypothetical protein EHQ12_11920 [Leptospira gomenensis]TGK48801.1 hypothetical protein EHQ07_05515 [Leptospira gomenensis]TGK64567.1 hypothetical protein EHQ13_06690 [Leptospira gomenensis]
MTDSTKTKIKTSDRMIPGVLALAFSLLLIQCNTEKNETSTTEFLALLGTSTSVVKVQNDLNRNGGLTTRETDAGKTPTNPTNETNSSDGHTAIRLIGDGTMVGGGLLVYVREQSGFAGDIAPVTITEGVPTFRTVPGKEYFAYLEFFIDGANDTEIDGAALIVPFTATETDKIDFYVTGTGAGLFVNDASHVSNLFYDPVGQNGMGNNPEERAAWRRSNFLLYGGEGFVVEYLYGP